MPSVKDFRPSWERQIRCPEKRLRDFFDQSHSCHLSGNFLSQNLGSFLAHRLAGISELRFACPEDHFDATFFGRLGFLLSIPHLERKSTLTFGKRVSIGLSEVLPTTSEKLSAENSFVYFLYLCELFQNFSENNFAALLKLLPTCTVELCEENYNSWGKSYFF